MSGVKNNRSTKTGLVCVICRIVAAVSECGRSSTGRACVILIIVFLSVIDVLLSFQEEIDSDR